MIHTRLYNFIKSNLDDEYVMSVLYYSVRKAVVDKDFNLKDASQIILSHKFLDEPVSINIKKIFDSKEKTMALLLSLRAILLDKKVFSDCRDDELFFKSYSNQRFMWIEYATSIVNHINDDDFYTLFGLLETVYYDDLTDEDKSDFISRTIVPEFRNLQNYYQTEAANNHNNTKDVIINNAFVCDDTIVEYEIPSSVEYIGNTAFSYCSNLEVLKFNRANTLFGIFPIVECEKLKRIMVPEGSEEYYKSQLSYYSDIIYTEKTWGDFIEKEPSVQEPQPGKNDTVQPFDPTKLKEIFNKRVTTYKYFWFLSILTLLKEKEELVYTYKELVIRMVSLAWPLIFADNLDFGKSDQLKKYLTKIRLISTLNDTSPRIAVENWLNQKYTDEIKNILSPLLKNVPYRFLSPWIKYISDEDVIEKSNSDMYAAPYALQDKCIIIDEDWFDYFVEHYDETYDFIKQSLIAYLKKYNNDLSLLGLISRANH